MDSNPPPTRHQGGTLGLLSVRGIPLRVHWSFFLLLVWVAFAGGDQGSSVREVLFVLAVFGCVVLHEFGHALMAARYGIRTRDIVLYPFGGIASLTAEPAPRAELLIALAGPSVNVAIAFLLSPFVDISEFQSTTTDPLEISFLASLLAANIVLAVFNMLPALPMDGGRVLRAVLALLNVERATIISARISQGISIALALFALATHNVLLLIIAVLVFGSAMQEHMHARARSAVLGQKVRDVMSDMRTVEVFPHGTTIAMALNLALRSFQPVFPVVHAGTVLGVVERERLLQAAVAGQEDYVSSIMDREFNVASPDDPLAQLVERLQSGEGSHYLVLEDERLVGLVVKDRLVEYLIVRGMRHREPLGDA